MADSPPWWPPLRGNPYMGSNLRQPYEGEANYFRQNPDVAGMAAEDNRVVLNPFTGLSGQGREAVYRNELARVLMRGNPDFVPPPITPEQANFLTVTTYANASDADRRATMAARVFSGDPSAGAVTPAQDQLARRLGTYLDVRGVPFTYAGGK